MTASANGLLTEKPRISSIDIMRGIVMVIMALDHVRDFVHADASVFNPTDLTQTHPFLFFTRWITHFCAPTFVFLSGTAARISLQRKTKKELSIFLVTRGLWLILLEVTIVRFAILFNFYYDFVIFQVIWVIGASMVVLAALIYLPQYLIASIGLLLIFSHDAFTLFAPAPNDPGFAVSAFLYQGSGLRTLPNTVAAVPYPLIPWLGIMIMGYAMGQWYTKDFDPTQRRKYLLYTGVSTVALFVLLRVVNVYGDPAPWAQQKNALFTLMSFLNCSKYPPSLLYTLMTLGPVLLILSRMERTNTKALTPFIVFGRVPLFYYVLHFSLAHAIGLILYIITANTPLANVDFHINKGLGGIPPGIGHNLFWVYVCWISIVLFLYPICKWYNHYKSTHDHWSLSYL